jgi:hypothetical protein
MWGMDRAWSSTGGIHRFLGEKAGVRPRIALFNGWVDAAAPMLILRKTA